jgi:hypothetical protein
MLVAQMWAIDDAKAANASLTLEAPDPVSGQSSILSFMPTRTVLVSVFISLTLINPNPYRLIVSGASSSPLFPLLVGLLTLIPKPGKARSRVTSYRPLTLLGCDIKLVSLVIANRLQIPLRVTGGLHTLTGHW